VHVHVVDPSAFTPPYDHALCAALARAGAEVERISSRFDHGPRPPAPGFAVRESFYRHAPGRPGSAVRRAAKLAEHGPDLLRYRAAGRAADVVHVQWLAVPPLDARLLPAGRRGLVYTAHNAAREGLGRAERRMCARAGAVVVHSEAARLEVETHRAAPAERVHVVPHGAFDYLADLPDEAPLPPELAATDVPVALCFGLLRPYKGIDVLLEAWRGVEGAELWIVGAPRMDLEPLRAAAPPGVRWFPASSPTRSSRPISGAPRSSSCRTPASTSRARPSPRWGSGSRSSSPTSAGSPTSRRRALRSSCRRATPPPCTPS